MVILDSNGQEIFRNTTNESGYYQICGLGPGDYRICEIMQTGWIPVDGISCRNITLTCSNISGIDFRNTNCCGSALHLEKTADFGPAPNNPARIGQTITYNITVSNPGNTTLYKVNVTDGKLGLRDQIPSLLPGESRTYNPLYNVTEGDICENITNVVNASAIDSCEKQLSNTSRWNVSVSYTGDIKIDKTANLSCAMVGDVIQYTYNVTNVGDVNLSDVEIEDDLLGPITKQE